jgi:hypothetical protein
MISKRIIHLRNIVRNNQIQPRNQRKFLYGNSYTTSFFNPPGIQILYDN